MIQILVLFRLDINDSKTIPRIPQIFLISKIFTLKFPQKKPLINNNHKIPGNDPPFNPETHEKTYCFSGNIWVSCSSDALASNTNP